MMALEKASKANIIRKKKLKTIGMATAPSSGVCLLNHLNTQ